MMPALRGVPGLVLGAMLSFAQPCFAQDGPLLPGLEGTDVPAAVDDAEPPALAPETAVTPSAEPLPVDDSITPLDENGRPMSGPEPERPLRLPAPPPLPAARQVPAEDGGELGGPTLPFESPETSGVAAEKALEPQPQKRNLWQRSTDALRELTQPKSKPEESVDQDAARKWQLLRQRELEQQRQMQQRQLQQRQLQQRQFQQQQQLQQRQLQQRELERQYQQRQLQQRRPVTPTPGWDPRTQTQNFQPQPQQNGAASQGVEVRSSAGASPQTSSRRRYGAPQQGYVPGSQTAPSSLRSRKPSQPREAKNEPRSPWERS